MIRKVCVFAVASLATAAQVPTLSVDVDTSTGTYSVLFDGQLWLTSPATGAIVCVGGANGPLIMGAPQPATNSDGFGTWTGVNVPWAPQGSSPVVQTTFKQYASNPALLVVTTQVLGAINTTGCNGNNKSSPSMTFPAFSTSAGAAPSLGFLSWDGEAVKNTIAVTGLANLPRGMLDAGPVIAFSRDIASQPALAWSTLDHHKIVVQAQDAGVYSVGPSSALPALPAGWEYSVVLRGSYGGPTAAAYAWGADMQAYHGTTRSPSVTLQKLGYYTDDGVRCSCARR